MEHIKALEERVAALESQVQGLYRQLKLGESLDDVKTMVELLEKLYSMQMGVKTQA